jgi:hypothetical protein
MEISKYRWMHQAWAQPIRRSRIIASYDWAVLGDDVRRFIAGGPPTESPAFVLFAFSHDISGTAWPRPRQNRPVELEYSTNPYLYVRYSTTSIYLIWKIHLFFAGHYVLSLSQPTRLVHFPVRILYGYHFTERYLPARKSAHSFSGDTRQMAGGSTFDMDMDTLLNLHVRWRYTETPDQLKLTADCDACTYRRVRG